MQEYKWVKPKAVDGSRRVIVVTGAATSVWTTGEDLDSVVEITGDAKTTSAGVGLAVAKLHHTLKYYVVLPASST